MPYYSDDLIEEVRSRNDIVDVIGQYVHLTKKGSTFRFFSDEAALSAASSRANTSSMICEGTDSSAFSSIDLKALSNSLYPFVFIAFSYLVLQYRTCPVQLRP